ARRELRTRWKGIRNAAIGCRQIVLIGGEKGRVPIESGKATAAGTGRRAFDRVEEDAVAGANRNVAAGTIRQADARSKVEGIDIVRRALILVCEDQATLELRQSRNLQRR